MQASVETILYQASQLFMMPVLLAVVVLFLYAFYALGAFLWQARQRWADEGAGFDLLATWCDDHRLTATELETLAFKRLEAPRIATRVAPMLGLVATMIPMGPALKALADGQLSQVSANLTVAFSAVILALLAASITYLIVNVRRRWYAEELLEIERRRVGRPDIQRTDIQRTDDAPEAVHALAQGDAS